MSSPFILCQAFQKISSNAMALSRWVVLLSPDHKQGNSYQWLVTSVPRASDLTSPELGWSLTPTKTWLLAVWGPGEKEERLGQTHEGLWGD